MTVLPVRLATHTEPNPYAMSSGSRPTFIGGPDTIIKQIRRCREEIGAGVLDLSLHPPGSGDVDALMSAIELFGKKVLPHIRDI